MAERHQTCRTCRHWDQNEEYEWDPADGPAPKLPDGACRRYPPSVLRTLPDLHTGHPLTRVTYPTTGEEWWCSEYAPRDPETVPEGAATLARLVLLGDLSAARALADRLREDG